jgi:diguanylate cyclase (GGDEF)-like protein/PAS domain S-box-containing protein
VALNLFIPADMQVWLTCGSLIAAVATAGWAFRAVRLRKAAEAQNAETASVVANISEGYYRASMDGTMLYANPAFVHMFGFEGDAAFLAAVNVIKKTGLYAETGRRTEFLDLLRTEGEVREFMSQVVLAKTGERVWITENARVVRDSKTGQPRYYEGTVRDTTDIALRMAEKERLIKLTSQVPGGLFQLERCARGAFEVVFTSTGFRDLLDWKSKDEKFDLLRFLAIIHPDDLQGYHATLKASRKQMTRWAHDFRVVTDGGKAKWMKVEATPELQADGRIVWHGYLQDVTESKADEAQVRSLAYHDTLTQLPNRRLLLERLHQTIAVCSRRNEFAAVLFMDLDDFKQLNDMHGHDAGDQLLVEIAKRLRKSIRRSDTVARLSGDEFVILLEGLGRDRAGANQKVAMVAEKTLAALAKGFDLGKIKHKTSASIGAITFDGSAKSVDDILKHADTAMYDVKRSGRNAYKIFEPGRTVESSNQLTIGEDLKHAVQSGQMALRLQPQVNRDGRIVGAEALIRWNHPKLGMLTPDKFMGLADQRGLAREIGSFVLESAAKLLSDWKRSKVNGNLKLAVNLSAQQFLDPQFVEELRLLIVRHKIDPSRLTLELTEQVIAKNRGDAIKAMERLKATGVRLSLDDFGTGFSSLAHLKEMPLDEVKIDGKFIRLMQNRPKDMALVKTILAMAEALGLATVAEHVETQEQEKFLLAQGCDGFQGYLYSGAMTRDDFEEAVRRNSVATGHWQQLAKVA